MLVQEETAKISLLAKALSRQSLMALPFSLSKRFSFKNSSIEIDFLLEKECSAEQITLN